MLKQMLKLVAQGLNITMIPVGSTPVLEYQSYNFKIGVPELVVPVVNFLRSGCASVQVAVVPQRIQNEQSIEFMDAWHDCLAALQLNEERFKIEMNNTDHLYHDGAVLLVTRTVAEKTR